MSLTNVNESAYTAARKHWNIETQLHWFLDVVCRKENAAVKWNPYNLQTVK